MGVIHLAYKPLPIHEPFHRTNVREKALIGAVGSGKTIALCADAIMLALTQPGSRIIVARQTVPSLRDTTERELLGILSTVPEEFEGKQKQTLYDLCETRRMGGHVDTLMFPNGSEILFRSLDDWRKLMSLNVCGIFIDEASETDADTYLALITRLRQREPTPEALRQGTRWREGEYRQVMALATNPNGHDWIWEYFVHAPNPGRRYFQSTSFDNPTLYLPSGEMGPYLESLLTMPEIWQKRYVWCNFDAFEGQILNFTMEDNVYQHFEIPEHWERAMGLDWGLRSPVAVGWWARDPKTATWYKYREWQSYDPTIQAERESYITLDVHQIAQRIRQIEGREVIKYRAADPAIRIRQGTDAKSIEYWFGYYGFHFTLGAKDHPTRINSLNLMLSTGQLKISSACPMTHIAYQQYRWEKLRTTRDVDQPERPRKKDDHLVDADQYLATIFTTNRKFSPPAKQYIPDWQQEIWESVKKKMKTRRR